MWSGMCIEIFGDDPTAGGAQLFPYDGGAGLTECRETCCTPRKFSSFVFALIAHFIFAQITKTIFFEGHTGRVSQF